MHTHEEREREENTNVSSAFERKTTSAKEKREQRDAKKFKRDRAKRAKSDPILSVFIFAKKKKKKKETKRNETRAPGATKRARFPTRARKMQSSPKRRRQRVNF